MSENRLEAVLWDMDGVITDTAEFHYIAWRDTLSRKGINLTREQYMRFFGQRPDTLLHGILDDNVPPAEINAIITDKEADFRRRIGNNIKALPGVVELIKSLTARGIKQAIASTAPPENIDVIIRGTGLNHNFQAIAFGDEVSEDKPSPQLYLLAARKLGIKPVNCVVFEDAIAGVAGAKSAGMKCIAVTNSQPRERLKQADLVVDSLEEISIDNISALFT